MIKLFKITAILEGISYLLLFANMFITKNLNLDLYKTILFPLGMAHGVLFIGYLLLALLVKKQQNWSIKTFLLVCLASLIPFATFYVVERRLINKSVKTDIIKMEENEIKKYDSIGGWLSLLCFALIIGSPIRNFIGLYIDYSGSSQYFNEIKGLENYIYINSICLIIMMILSIWSGISLLRIKSYAVLLTKVYLTIFLLYGTFQSLIPELAGLDQTFIESINEELKKSTISSVLVFGIWFIYLSVSERVKQTFPTNKYISNLTDIVLNKIDYKKSIIQDYYKNSILPIKNRIKLNDLTSDEVIIISVIIGTLISLIFGYISGEIKYFDQNGERAIAEHYLYSEYNFNYVSAIASFIIFGGISYIYLNRKNNKND